MFALTSKPIEPGEEKKVNVQPFSLVSASGEAWQRVGHLVGTADNPGLQRRFVRLDAQLL